MTLDTTDKLALVRRLERAGLTWIEVASFGSPKRVPQLADAEQVIAALDADASVVHAAFAPNEKVWSARSPVACARSRPPWPPATISIGATSTAPAPS